MNTKLMKKEFEATGLIIPAGGGKSEKIGKIKYVIDLDFNCVDVNETNLIHTLGLGSNIPNYAMSDNQKQINSNNICELIERARFYVSVLEEMRRELAKCAK